MNGIRFLFFLVLSSTLLWADLGQVFTSDKVNLEDLHKYKRALAVDFAKELSNPVFHQFVIENIQAKASCSLSELLETYLAKHRNEALSEWSGLVQKLDKGICETKGIADQVENLLEVRLAIPETVRSLNEGNLLVSYVPKGDEIEWTTIEAFDKTGQVHYLDAHKEPEVPVLVVGLDSKQDKQAGLALLNKELQKAGLQTTNTETRGLAVAKLNYIRLNDDKEPWLLGDAEIYMMVNGISPEASKANVISMDLPYLDKDKRDYHPNQVLIIWDNYRYHAANLNVFEHDDSTNYKEIAVLLIKGIGQVATEYQAIFDIASRIISLMPDGWFSNDDDYVDVFYTLEKGKTYTNYYGASKNAKITLVPHTINE